jgi:hypothetical protein
MTHRLLKSPNKTSQGGKHHANLPDRSRHACRTCPAISPCAKCRVISRSEQLHGAIQFYLHKRPDTKSPYTSTPGLPGPLLDIRPDGRTLHFQVSHRLAHPPRTLNDPPVKFQLKLTGRDEAELVNESESAPGLPMKRTDY